MWSHSCSFPTSPNFILYRDQSKHNINIANKTSSEWNDNLQLYFIENQSIQISEKHKAYIEHKWDSH